LLIGVFDVLTPDSVQLIDRCSSHWKFRRFDQTWSGGLENVHYGQRETACRRAGTRPNTWILHTDLDELLEFPAPVRQITQAAAEKNITAIHGHFVDRVAADGSLPPIQPHPSLWEQFPVACKLSGNILKGVTKKVMLSRYSVHVSSGHHDAIGLPVLPPPIGTPQSYRVAHFKWRNGILSQLQRVLEEDSWSAAQKCEVRRFFAWLNEHDGKIDLSNPMIEARGLPPHQEPALQS
jgi:hypothetical protein